MDHVLVAFGVSERVVRSKAPKGVLVIRCVFPVGFGTPLNSSPTLTNCSDVVLPSALVKLWSKTAPYNPAAPAASGPTTNVLLMASGWECSLSCSKESHAVAVAVGGCVAVTLTVPPP